MFCVQPKDRMIFFLRPEEIHYFCRIASLPPATSSIALQNIGEWDSLRCFTLTFWPYTFLQNRLQVLKTKDYRCHQAVFMSPYKDTEFEAERIADYQKIGTFCLPS